MATGTLTLANFRTEVQSAMGDRGFDDTRLDRWINWAYLDLTGAIQFEELDDELDFNTASADYDYDSTDFPTNPRVIKLIRDVDNTTLLRWVPKMEFWRRFGSEANGTPTIWTRDRNQILLFPTPDSIIAMEAIFQKTPTQLSASGDQTALTPEWDPAIFMIAVHHGLLAVGEESRAGFWFQRGVAYIQSRLTEDELKRFNAGLGATLPEMSEATVNADRITGMPPGA